ncbi:hypothetical protein R1flu_012833 [Riccia fluitans]|uniref:H15 domain-containing protein n=1 Tax=Riccia fluitans TaxID=41844 RepID=A0ABD1ZBR6_9MARC
MANPADLGGEPSGSKARGKGLQHPTYANLIHDAISSLKQRGGSSAIAIRKSIEQKVGPTLGPNYKKIVGSTLSKLAKTGKLIKTGNTFKLSPEFKIEHLRRRRRRGGRKRRRRRRRGRRRAGTSTLSGGIATARQVADAKEEEEAEAALLAVTVADPAASAPGEFVTPPTSMSTAGTLTGALPATPLDIDPRPCRPTPPPSIDRRRATPSQIIVMLIRTLRVETLFGSHIAS